MNQWDVTFNIGHTEDKRFWALQHKQWYRRIVVIGELEDPVDADVSDIAQQLLREYQASGGDYIAMYAERGAIPLPENPRDIYGWR